MKNLYLSREQTLEAEAHRGVSCDQARARLVEGADPHDVHEPGLLRQSRLRDRSRRRDVLLRPRQAARSRAGRAPRGPAAGAVQRTTRSSAPPTRSPAETRCCARCGTTATSRSRRYPAAVADHSLHLNPGTAYTHIREPYFFGYVEDLLQQEYGTNTVRSGGLKVYTTIIPRLQRAARHGDHRRSEPAVGSGVRARLDRSAQRGDPRHDRCHSRQLGEPVQLRDERAPAAGIDVQDDRPRRCGRAGPQSLRGQVPLGAVPLHTRLDVRVVRSDVHLERPDLRSHLSRR